MDIGFHYVAVDGNGKPLDTDSNGIPDYLEDSDGDGVSNALELLLGRNPYVYGTVQDTNGLINLKIYTPLK